MTKPRIILHDAEELHRQTLAALETGMTLAAVSKQAIHAQRAAQLQASLAMMRCGVKVLADSEKVRV